MTSKCANTAIMKVQFTDKIVLQKSRSCPMNEKYHVLPLKKKRAV